MDGNPKWVDEVDKGNPLNQWEVDKWQEGDKRGINVKKKSISSLILLESGSGGGKSNSRERKSNFSIDFSTFGSSIRVAPRNKVVLRFKGYAWTLVLWSFDNSGR